MKCIRKYLEKFRYVYGKIKKLFQYSRGQINELERNYNKYGAYSKILYIAIPEKKVLYVSNPKVACSSIKSSILKLQEDDYHNIHLKAESKSKYIRDKKKFKETYNNYFKFSFVRNPYERLVSCYKNKYYTDKKYIGKSLENFQFDNYLFGFLRKNKGFTNFAIRVCLIPDKFAEEHFRSQYYLLYTEDDECLVNYVGHFENLEHDYDAIRKKYRFEELPHYNQTNLGEWRDYYNPFTAWLVYRHYYKDFTKFGYKREYRRLQNYLRRQAK